MTAPTTDLSRATAANLTRIALGHVGQEYPGVSAEVLNGPADLALTTRDFHPIFYGSLDWHSCVHGYWLLSRLNRLFPGLPQRQAIVAQYPVPQADFETFMAHLNHALEVAGVDHVGIGLDMDGGGGLTGLHDVSDDWKITARLLREGYSEADVQKIWSGNVLRLLRAAEAEAAREGAGK